jgi:hypothetical protein
MSLSIRFWLLYAIADIICTGMGMGVPIFCILLGFPVGYILARRAIASSDNDLIRLRGAMYYAVLTAGLTMLGMVLLWGRFVTLLFEPTFDFANFGIPMILYGPKASFIGWLILMIIISPFLQFLMTLFGAHLTLLLKRQQQDLKVQVYHNFSLYTAIFPFKLYILNFLQKAREHAKIKD